VLREGAYDHRKCRERERVKKRGRVRGGFTPNSHPEHWGERKGAEQIFRTGGRESGGRSDNTLARIPLLQEGTKKCFPRRCHGTEEGENTREHRIVCTVAPKKKCPGNQEDRLVLLQSGRLFTGGRGKKQQILRTRVSGGNSLALTSVLVKSGRDGDG